MIAFESEEVQSSPKRSIPGDVSTGSTQPKFSSRRRPMPRITCGISSMVGTPSNFFILAGNAMNETQQNNTK